MIQIGSKVYSKKLIKESTAGIVVAMVHKNVQAELKNAVYDNGNAVVASGEDTMNAFERWSKLYPNFEVVCWVTFEEEVSPFSGIVTDSIFIPLDDLGEVEELRELF